MTKKDPNIIRIGDRVKIITPDIFERCGYPLSHEQAREQVEIDYGDDVQRFLANIEHLMREGKESAIFLAEGYQNPIPYLKIIDALVYSYIGIKHFGGNERTMHTQTIKHMMGERHTVATIRYVKTGIYHPPTNTNNEDYDPGYLSDGKSHKILGLSNVIHVVPFDLIKEKASFEIEDINVRRIRQIER